MPSPRRPLIALFIVAACAFALAAASVALGSTAVNEPATVSVKPPASVGVLTCKSSGYYANRSVAFRVKMFRQDPAVPQKLEVRLEVWRKLNEDTKFRKFKIDGLGTWKAADDPDATGYQRDYTINNVETAASYRAKANYRWSDSTGTTVQARRTVWSKPCKQKVQLPRLQITLASAVPIPGTTDIMHTLTVANIGSEAINVPIAIYVDSQLAVSQTVPSIGPKQTLDVQLQAPACADQAYAALDPLRTMPRLQVGTRAHFPLARCR